MNQSINKDAENKIVAAGKYIVTGDVNCIELIEEGYIYVDESVKELTIHKLINKKKNPIINKFDILVTGKDGADAPYETGEKGEDGSPGGQVKITVNDLVGDVSIKASGGHGGCGGKGIEGKNGGKGGNGGDGGKAADVDFYYATKKEKSTSYASTYSAEGGNGGRGGSGGICTGTYGQGGECGERGTKGGSFGDGGDGGKKGENGMVTIHHPDGSVTYNNTEYQDNTPAVSGRYHFDIDRELRIFIQHYGGEDNLKKYPNLWSAIMRKRRMQDSRNDAVIEGEISQVDTVFGESENTLSEKSSAGSFCKLSLDVHMMYANARLEAYQADAKDIGQPVSWIGVLNVTNLDTGFKVWGTRLYGEGDVTTVFDKIESDTLPDRVLEGKKLRIDFDVSYMDKEGEISDSVLFTKEYTAAKQEKFIQKVRVTAPHWKQGKTSGGVVFLYGRTPSQQEVYRDADYYGGDYFHNVYNSSTHELRTIIPISGTIQLKNINAGTVVGASVGAYGGNEVSRVLYGIDEQNLMARHRKDLNADQLVAALNKQSAVSYDSKTNKVTFDLKLPPVEQGRSVYDWNCNVAAGFLDDSSHRCMLDGCFVLNVKYQDRNSKTHEALYDIHIYSNANPQENVPFYEGENEGQVVIIPPIMIYWGCYAKDTLITIIDETQGHATEIQRRADEIKIGDKLPAMGEKLLTVEEILTGEDRQIMEIRTSDGRHISVSGGHAMWACTASEKEGCGKRIVARKLKKGDWLLSPDGKAQITEITVVPYQGNVYNFIFKEEKLPNYIKANGFWSGEFYAQNVQEEKKAVQLSEKAKIMMEEMKKFAADAKQ